MMIDRRRDQSPKRAPFRLYPPVSFNLSQRVWTVWVRSAVTWTANVELAAYSFGQRRVASSLSNVASLVACLRLTANMMVLPVSPVMGSHLALSRNHRMKFRLVSSEKNFRS